MPLSTLTARAHALWESLANSQVEFAPVVSVAAAPESRLCPPGWTGIVVIGDTAIATAPDPDTAHAVHQALSALPAASLTDVGMLTGRLHVAEILGPASLAYLDPGTSARSTVTPRSGLSVRKTLTWAGSRPQQTQVISRRAV